MSRVTEGIEDEGAGLWGRALAFVALAIIASLFLCFPFLIGSLDPGSVSGGELWRQVQRASGRLSSSEVLAIATTALVYAGATSIALASMANRDESSGGGLTYIRLDFIRSSVPVMAFVAMTASVGRLIGNAGDLMSWLTLCIAVVTTLYVTLAIDFDNIRRVAASLEAARAIEEALRHALGFRADAVVLQPPFRHLMRDWFKTSAKFAFTPWVAMAVLVIALTDFPGWSWTYVAAILALAATIVVSCALGVGLVFALRAARLTRDFVGVSLLLVAYAFLGTISGFALASVWPSLLEVLFMLLILLPSILVPLAALVYKPLTKTVSDLYIECLLYAQQDLVSYKRRWLAARQIVNEEPVVEVVPRRRGARVSVRFGAINITVTRWR